MRISIKICVGSSPVKWWFSVMRCLDMFEVPHVIFGELGDGMGEVEAQHPPQLGDLILHPVLHGDVFEWGHEDGHHVLQNSRP